MTRRDLLTVGFLALVLGMCSQALPSSGMAAAPDEIRIGATAPLTGPAAEAGVALRQGLLLAVEEWNAKGGIQIREVGKKLQVKMLIEDSQQKPEVGVSMGEKLITRDKVHFLMGDTFSSSVTMAMMELAPKYGIPMMSVEPVSAEITKKIAANPQRYWSFWKGDWNSDAYGNTIFSTYRFLMDRGMFKPRNKTIAFVIEDTDYGRSNAEKASQLFSGTGWKTVANETVALGYTDFYPQLSKLKTLDPDILVTVFTALASGVAHSKQFLEVGLKASQFAIYYPLRPEYRDQVGKDGEGLMWSPLTLDSPNNAKHKELADKIQKRWNVTCTSDHAAGYDAAVNVMYCIERAGTLESKAIVDAVSKLDLKGYMGRYVFEPKTHMIMDGEQYIPVPAAQIQNGKHVMIWPPAMASGTYKPQPWLPH